MTDDLIIDLSNYKERMGNRVAPDRYRVQVEDAELTESAAKNKMINLWFRIIGGDFDGQTVTDRLVLTEKSLFRVVGFMQAIGLPTPKKRLKLNIRQFVGRTLDIDVDDGEPWNGRVRSEVRAYSRIPKSEKPNEDLEEQIEETSSSAEDLPEPAEAIETVTEQSTQTTAAPEVSSADEGVEDEDAPVDLDSIDAL